VVRGEEVEEVLVAKINGQDQEVEEVLVARGRGRGGARRRGRGV
jgi:hypothetical protein